MITVTCPNCKVENSALSRRCISCGSELIIDGYIRCDNCRALTPENLEFCELCGSFLAIANGFSALEDDFTSAHEP
ncbi:MAG: double zinc ribbon domain-containing protein, partial [Candidatus Promineifilaceae bacterium]